MSKRLWTGLLAGVLGATALVAVGVGAFHAGQRHEITTVAPTTDVAGETVRVVGYGHHWGPGWGGPPFGFLFPLLIIGLIVLLVAGRRRAYWGGRHGYAYGGPGGWGGPCGPGGKEAALADWHQKAHAGAPEAPPGPPGDA